MLPTLLLIALSHCVHYHQEGEAATSVRAGALVPVDVFSRGEAGYNTFRIPATIQTAEGRVLAFCEGRKHGASDSGDIDIVLKRSEDGGATWSELEVLWDDDVNTCGNPCPVLDRESGDILLLMTHNLGHDHENEIIDQTSEGTRTVWISRSEDQGTSWSEPEEITGDTKLATWTWYATGPGAGIQLERGKHAGRLVIPCDHIEAETRRYFSHVIFSDDHGKSWHLGGSTPRDQVNECEVVELEDGGLMLNMRNYDRSKHRRQVALSSDGGASWSHQRHDPTLIEPICQASLRRLRWATEQAPGVLLFSNPADESSRRRLTVRASFDDGASWPLAHVLHEGSSAYSCLVALQGGDAGCLFEADSYGRILFTRLPASRFAP